MKLLLCNTSGTSIGICIEDFLYIAFVGKNCALDTFPPFQRNSGHMIGSVVVVVVVVEVVESNRNSDHDSVSAVDALVVEEYSTPGVGKKRSMD